MASTPRKQRVVLVALFFYICWLMTAVEGFGPPPRPWPPAGKRSAKLLRQKRVLRQDICDLALKHCRLNYSIKASDGIHNMGSIHLINKRDIKSEKMNHLLQDLCQFAEMHCRLQQLKNFL